jgi:EAL domain-containing protein (putative c-di-GMP-specific phosphodiesterase class I)
LLSFEVDVVKLDGALTKNLRSCARSRQILLGLINLTHATGALCVAEHIESQEQLDLVSAMGCDMVQGFLLSHPVSAEQVHQLPPLQAAPIRQNAVQ